MVGGESDVSAVQDCGDETEQRGDGLRVEANGGLCDCALEIIEEMHAHVVCETSRNDKDAQF